MTESNKNMKIIMNIKQGKMFKQLVNKMNYHTFIVFFKNDKTLCCFKNECI